MKVQLNDGLADELLSELMEEIEEDRTGQHPSVTDLIHCLTQSWYNSHGGRLPFTMQTKVFFLLGLGLERALLAKRKETELVGQHDGIWFHVDSRDEGLVEMKSTRASDKKHLEGEFSDSWVMQTKSYCKAVGVMEVDIAVVYLVKADFRVYHVSFTEQELDEHWEWMLRRKEVWDKAEANGNAPEAFMWNQDWECKDCQYLILCQTRHNLGV